jgi:hypothetical protein
LWTMSSDQRRLRCRRAEDLHHIHARSASCRNDAGQRATTRSSDDHQQHDPGIGGAMP